MARTFAGGLLITFGTAFLACSSPSHKGSPVSTAGSGGGTQAGGSGGSVVVPPSGTGGSAGTGGGAAGTGGSGGSGTGGEVAPDASADDAPTAGTGGSAADSGVAGTGGPDAVIGDDTAPPPAGDGGPAASCTYKDDPSFCSCMGWSCGGLTMKDATGAFHTVYCGQCSNTQFCQYGATYGAGVGKCGGTNPLVYDWQRQKIAILISMGENDNTSLGNYSYVQNIMDGRGYTVGKVGFTTGTGDFIEVSRCYTLAEATNVLAKYWGHVNAMGMATDGLLYYADQFFTTMVKTGDDTKLIDSLAMGSSFTKDIATAAKDPLFRQCQDSMADAYYLSAAVTHAQEKGLQGALTIGFLYDTEINFGDEDDSGTAGTKTVISRADKDYGAGLPTDFTGKPWEESRWLGFLIKERTAVMATNADWKSDIDQNATWEVARRLHTGKTNTPESATDLSMDYDITSAYKGGFKTPAPCWTGLPGGTPQDSQSTVYIVSIDKSASATDQTKWMAKATTGPNGGQNYLACPPNPTP